jgi:dihydroxyacetone kinase-like predicted kinase
MASENAAPSTIEFVDAARATGAARVLLLPGDIDVHASAALAAHQLGIDGIHARVIGTRSAAESLAALGAMDSTTDDEVPLMNAAVIGVRSASVAVAGRDAMTPAGLCRAGDVMGLIGGAPVLVSSVATTADMCLALVDRLLDQGGTAVTVIVGADGDGSVAKRILADHPGVDVRVYQGGQRTTVYQVGVA